MNIKHFVSLPQLYVIRQNQKGEEGEFFLEKEAEIQNIIDTMPGPREQDGKGELAVAHLRYFGSLGHCFILEKDVDDGEGQIQAFGYLNFGHGGEYSYINIKELIENGFEMDLFYTPKTMGEILGE